MEPNLNRPDLILFELMKKHSTIFFSGIHDGVTELEGYIRAVSLNNLCAELW